MRTVSGLALKRELWRALRYRSLYMHLTVSGPGRQVRFFLGGDDLFACDLGPGYDDSMRGPGPVFLYFAV
jgi:hypothetical protein